MFPNPTMLVMAIDARQTELALAAARLPAPVQPRRFSFLFRLVNDHYLKRAEPCNSCPQSTAA